MQILMNKAVMKYCETPNCSVPSKKLQNMNKIVVVDKSRQTGCLTMLISDSSLSN